jgi:hypothetical protein
VDALDFAIFRQLSPDGEARFSGSRRVIDPRISAADTSSKAG